MHVLATVRIHTLWYLLSTIYAGQKMLKIQGIKNYLSVSDNRQTLRPALPGSQWESRQCYQHWPSKEACRWRPFSRCFLCEYLDFFFLISFTNTYKFHFLPLASLYSLFLSPPSILNAIFLCSGRNTEARLAPVGFDAP